MKSLPFFENKKQVEYVGDYKSDKKNYYFRRFNGAIGSFAWKLEDYNEGILYQLSDFDIDFYNHIKLKPGEVLLRYKTDRMISGEHLIKINLDKSLLYFVEDSEDDKNPKFYSRGIKAEYIVLEYGSLSQEQKDNINS